MHTLRLLALAAVSGVLAFPQFRGGADWTTAGNDAQRSGWVRADGKINTKTVAAGKVEFLWKKKLVTAPAQTYSLGSAVLMDRFIGHRGFRSYAFVAGAGNTAVGMDSDLGLIEWQSKLVKTPAPAGTFDCPGGVASITRPTASEFPGGGAGIGGRRGGPPSSGVGEPFAGAVTMKETPVQRPGRPAGPGAQVKRAVVLHMLASDGTFHTGYVSNGEEPKPGVEFLPANASATGFSVIDEIGYAVTGRGCGNVPDGLWALKLDSGSVSKWISGSPIAGGMAAFDGDGVAYVATAAGEIAALAPQTLSPKHSFKYESGFTAAPVVFQHKGKTYVSAAAKNGTIFIFDSALTPVANAGRADAAAGLATWVDASGNRSIVASTGKNVVSWKVSDNNGVPKFEPGWVSREFVTPATPIVVNNVVFALSTGEKRAKDARTTAASSVPAVLYALDSATGKDIWNSGKSITSFSGSGGLSSGGSQLYVQTYDGTLYAFGVAIEK